ncbi:MAG: Txe/YoeB family addiction module toxin [Bacteroidota bacterium]
MRLARLDPDAVRDLAWWRGRDPEGAQRVVNLIEATRHRPYDGQGDPEPLIGQLTGLWSRRIDAEHWLVYDVSDEGIRVLACRYERDA